MRPSTKASRVASIPIPIFAESRASLTRWCSGNNDDKRTPSHARTRSAEKPGQAGCRRASPNTVETSGGHLLPSAREMQPSAGRPCSHHQESWRASDRLPCVTGSLHALTRRRLKRTARQPCLAPDPCFAIHGRREMYRRRVWLSVRHFRSSSVQDFACSLLSGVAGHFSPARLISQSVGRRSESTQQHQQFTGIALAPTVALLTAALIKPRSRAMASHWRAPNWSILSSPSFHRRARNDRSHSAGGERCLRAG